MAAPPLIGVDFDNTIVCYDQIFHRVCRERGLIPAETPVNKSDVRNHLRRVGREEDWTEMQGYVYGARMAEAEAYPGVFEFLRGCRSRGWGLRIISHKTLHPYRGPQYDLHAAARAWLEAQGVFDPARLGFGRDEVCFELTKQAKLERIAACGCTHFIDDLPEFLAEPGFPAGVHRLLFDPNGLYGAEPFPRFARWSEAAALIA